MQSEKVWSGELTELLIRIPSGVILVWINRAEVCKKARPLTAKVHNVFGTWELSRTDSCYAKWPTQTEMGTSARIASQNASQHKKSGRLKRQ